jgi:hypothetical protein
VLLRRYEFVMGVPRPPCTRRIVREDFSYPPGPSTRLPPLCTLIEYWPGRHRLRAAATLSPVFVAHRGGIVGYPEIAIGRCTCVSRCRLRQFVYRSYVLWTVRDDRKGRIKVASRRCLYGKNV